MMATNTSSTDGKRPMNIIEKIITHYAQGLTR